MDFFKQSMIFHSRDNCLLHHLLQYTCTWQKPRSVSDMYVYLITHSTLYTLCHANYQELVDAKSEIPAKNTHKQQLLPQ